MSKNTNSFEIPDPFESVRKALANLTSTFEVFNKVNETFSTTQIFSGAFKTIDSIQSITKNLYTNQAYEAILKSTSTIQSILAEHQIPTALDLVSKMDQLSPWFESSPRLPAIDWDWMSKELSAQKDYSLDDVDELLTDTIREELDNSVQSTFTTENPPKNIEQRYGEWKQKHPLLADLYLSLIGFVLGILGGIITSCIPGITTKNSNVYDAPTSTSNVITNISVNQNITVVNEVPYYYEITFTHPETGKKISGYIYKPNITTSQESDETTDVTED